MEPEQGTVSGEMSPQADNDGRRVFCETDRVQTLAYPPMNNGGSSSTPSSDIRQLRSSGGGYEFPDLLDLVMIDPVLSTPQNEEMGADVAQSAAHLLQERTHSVTSSGDHRNLYNKINRTMDLNADLPWSSGMLNIGGAASDYDHDYWRWDAQSGFSVNAHSHIDDRSVFSNPNWTITTNTTNDFVYQHNGLPELPWPLNNQVEEERDIEDTTRSPREKTYAAAVRGGPSHQSRPNTFQQMHGMPPQPPSAHGGTPISLPEVLLCLKDGCPTTFTGNFRLGNRGRHMRTKHGKTMYDCPICGKPYRRSDARLKHLRKAHPGSAAEPVGRRQIAAMNDFQQISEANQL